MDYTALGDVAVMFPALSEMEAVSGGIVTLEDAVVEGSESLVITVTDPGISRLTVTASTAVVITDDDSATLTVDSSSYGEADGTVTVGLTLSNALAADLDVVVSTADGTATAGRDYTALGPVTVSFAAGVTSGNISLSILEDTIIEGDETLSLDFSATVVPGRLSGILTVPSTESLSIRDNDTARLRLSSAPVSVAEDVSGGVAELTLELLDSTFASALEVTLTTTGSGANAAVAAAVGTAISALGTADFAP